MVIVVSVTFQRMVRGNNFTQSRTVSYSTFPHNKSGTAIDNIFINTLHFNTTLITAPVNELSDHDVQLITDNEINIAINMPH